MYGRKACRLVKETATGEKGQIKPFNVDLFNQVIKECSSHHLELQSLFRNIQEGLDIQTTRNADFYGALIHHLSLTRNKRCVMAYMYIRAEVIRILRWKLGRVLPEEISKKLSSSEKEYLKGYSASIDAYMNDINLDLTVVRLLSGLVSILLLSCLRLPYIRAEVIRILRWKLGRVLPEEISKKLSSSEKEYLKGYSASIDAYMNDINLDLTVDMVPPKDPYIQARVLDDIGEVVLTDRLANLARHSMHFLKRTDAEPYISQGLMEELVS